MIYIIPTHNGFGVELWGTNEDLTNIYSFIRKFAGRELLLNNSEYKNREDLISGFSYEIRQANNGHRLKSTENHYTLKKQEYYGCKISWVHFLFSLSGIKYNMTYFETTKFDVSQILLIEFWLEKAMKTYDEVYSTELIDFIDDGLFDGNKYIYQYMRSINLEYYRLGGGKEAFQKLSQLLKRGIYLTKEYKEFELFLKQEAFRLGCDINDLDIDDDKIDYDNIVW